MPDRLTHLEFDKLRCPVCSAGGSGRCYTVVSGQPHLTCLDCQLHLYFDRVSRLAERRSAPHDSDLVPSHISLYGYPTDQNRFYPPFTDEVCRTIQQMRLLR